MNPLTDAEKVDVRRFCGYPAYGAAPTGLQSWRYFQVYGLLEFRVAHLSDSEISIVRRYLATLTTLEIAVPATSENLDTDQASMWTRNKDDWRIAFGCLTNGGVGSAGFLVSLWVQTFLVAR